MDGAEITRRLTAIGALPDAGIDLAGAALLLAAAADPAQDIAAAQAHLDAIAADLAATDHRNAADAATRAALLAEVLAQRHGYYGDSDSYDDLANADLIKVIARKRGLPVALSILWIHAGRARGWAVDGLDMPAHFVIRVGGAADEVVVDPFAGGRIVAAEELRALLVRIAGAEAARAPPQLHIVSNRAILLRLQNNIKARLLKAGDGDGARAVVARMLLIDPQHAGLWHEAGALDAESGNLRAAAAALARAAALAPDAATRHRIEAQRRAIAARLN